MKTEIEAKYPDINRTDFLKKLKKSRATLVHPEVLMRRRNFDFPDRKLEKIGGWVRVRDEGDKTTLIYKQLNDRTLHGTKEVDVVVGSFEKICEFLLAIGLEQKSYQETKREKWVLDKTEITIDTWPWVPSFVEIEGQSEEEVREISKRLGFDWSNAMHGSVETIYQMHYDFTEAEIDGWESITFTPEPKWLLVRRKEKVN